MAKRRGVKRKSKRTSRRKTKRVGKRTRRSTKFSKAIQSLRRMKPNQRHTAIRHANDKFIRDLVCHVRKLRHKKLTGKALNVVRQHSGKLRLISNPKVSLKRKRAVLSQKGGILPLLLPLMGPLVGAAAGPILSKIING